MATASVLCPNCDKQEGIVPCLGCKQVFCVKHFQSHRQNLFVELENVVTRRNTLQEHYYDSIAPTFDATKLDAWTDIDEWEQQIHEQVRRTAEQARKQLSDYAHQSRTHVEQQLNRLTEHIQQKMERENFVEEDITKLTEQIDQIEDELNNNRHHPRVQLVSEPINWTTSMQVKRLVDQETPAEKIETVLTPPPAPAVPCQPKYLPSVQRKCHTCGTDTWQKECKCCAHTYCGWHLKRHSLESKKR